MAKYNDPKTGKTIEAENLAEAKKKTNKAATKTKAAKNDSK